MNRRTFLAALVATPAVAATALTASPPAPLNLDEIIEMLYRIKRNRSTQEYIDIIRPDDFDSVNPKIWVKIDSHG